jgi:prophage regulatory protein
MIGSVRAGPASKERIDIRSEENAGLFSISSVRLPAVKQRTGLSRSTIYLRMTQGTFPAPVSLGARAVGWVESEIDDWIARKIAEIRKLAPADGKPL